MTSGCLLEPEEMHFYVDMLTCIHVSVVVLLLFFFNFLLLLIYFIAKFLAPSELELKKRSP